MVLEWNDDNSLWHEECDDIIFELNKVWVYTLDRLGRLRNNNGRFYYNNEEYGLSAGLTMDGDGQAWITWGEVEDDS